MITNPPNVLIVGCGSIGERHLRCFQSTGAAKVAACDSNAALLEKVSATYQVPKFATLDEALATYNEQLPRLQEFILPAGTRGAALAHVCRTVARRAERAVVALGNEEALKETPRQYLNRLSDLMFVLARVLNRHRSDGSVGDDVYWRSERLKQGAAE